MPKIKRIARRVRGSDDALLTPNLTQGPNDSAPQILTQTTQDSTLTPAPTQDNPPAAHEETAPIIPFPNAASETYQFGVVKPVSVVPVEELDPILPGDSAAADQEHDVGNRPTPDLVSGDLFLERGRNPASRRASSVVSRPTSRSTSRRPLVALRRLSGIIPFRPLTGLSDDPNHVPQRIAIPIAKPVKRRRSLVRQRRPSTPPYEPPILEPLQAKPISSSNTADSEFIMGIDPEKNVIRKYRKLTATESRVSAETASIINSGQRIPDNAIEDDEPDSETTPPQGKSGTSDTLPNHTTHSELPMAHTQPEGTSETPTNKSTDQVSLKSTPTSDVTPINNNVQDTPIQATSAAADSEPASLPSVRITRQSARLHGNVGADEPGKPESRIQRNRRMIRMGMDPEESELLSIPTSPPKKKAKATRELSRKLKTPRPSAEKAESLQIGSSTGANPVPLAPSELITAIGSVKQLPRQIGKADIALYSHLRFDEQAMTMADLCKPYLPVGEVSSNYALVCQAEAKKKQNKIQRRINRWDARNERIPLEDVVRRSQTVANTGSDKASFLDTPLEAEQQHTTLKLMVNADGKMEVDTDSQVVSRHLRADNSQLMREESNPFENPVISLTYSKRSHTDKWTADEMVQFYEALSMFGTDFSLIAQIFPYRNRRQVKQKFNLEERYYPEVVEMALRRKLPADFAAYCHASKQEIHSLDHYNEQLRQVRLDHEQHLTQISEAKAKAVQQDAEANRQREVTARTGYKAMLRLARVRELRKNEVVVGSVDEKPTVQKTEVD